MSRMVRSGGQRRYFSEVLDLVGDGSGSMNAAVDGTTPVPFLMTCQSSEILYIGRLVVFIEDVGQFLAETYGAVAALANGVTIEVTDAAGVAQTDILRDAISTGNAHWAAQCHDSVPHTYGSGANMLSTRWTFAFTGEDSGIRLDPGMSIQAIVKDDLTGLVAHEFRVQGYRQT